MGVGVNGTDSKVGFPGEEPCDVHDSDDTTANSGCSVYWPHAVKSTKSGVQ